MSTSNKSKVAPVPGSTVADAGEVQTMSNTTHDMKVFKNCGKIAIPDQLASFQGARFILIDKIKGEGKKPKERKWTTDANYVAHDPKLLGHIRGGGNYGIATGISWLHCIDIDDVERVRELGILEKLPQTLTVKTGGDGLHYWYEIEGLQKRITFYHPTIKEDGKETEFLHLGEVQSRGNYAIGPNSIHRTGKPYTIIDDSKIAKLSYEDLMEILSPLRLKKKDNRPNEKTRNGKEQYEHNEVDIERIGAPRGNVVELNGANGKELRGEHPFHGSKTGQNFSINPKKGVWHCFRHGSGGGWAELLAVKEGIISCEQAGKNCMSKSQFRQVMQIAENIGLTEEKTIEATITIIEMDREVLEQIPKTLPNGELVVLVAPPRTGKTHAVVQWLANNGQGNYITHTHAIVEHAIRIAKDLKIKSVVWVVGMNQKDACVRTGERNCTECPLKHGPDNHMQMVKTASELLKEKGILTATDIPRNLCPYYILKMAEEHARYCFTVVNNINAIIPRSLTILDEEPVLSHFYATSIKIGTIKTRAGETTTKNFIAKSTDLQRDLDMILNKRKKPALKEYAKKIKEISDIFDQGIDEGWKAAEIAGEIEDALIGYSPKHREMQMEGEQSGGDELSLETCVRCLGNIYREEGKSPVSVAKEPGGYLSIYVLGDERKTSCAMGWKEKTKKIIVIGATKAELFAKEFNGREVVIEKFRYDNRFLVIGVNKTNIGDARGEHQAQQKKIIDIAKEIWQNSEETTRMPFMILTGSKKEQDKVGKMLPGSTLISKERESGMDAEYVSGKPVSIYQNSIVSRGLDVDEYNLLLVYGCNFAQPFWTIADPGIAAAIISDETTNSVLRISSNLRTDNGSFKVVVMQKNDMRKVKYLNNFLVRSDDADVIAKGLKSMGVGGLTKRNGRKGWEVIKTHVNFETGRANLIEKFSTVNEFFGDKEKESMMAAIVRILESKRKEGIKSLNSSSIYKLLKNTNSENLVRSALQELHYKKILDMEKHGKTNKWSIKRIHK